MRVYAYSAAVAFALSGAATSAQAISWARYSVPETGASVDIPISIFTESAKPQAGYGRHFLSADRHADVMVQSVPNADGESPAEFLARRNAPADIAYKKIAPRFFVVSSFRKDRIWYDRCNFSARYVNCVLISYPAAEKTQWDSIVTRMSNSLTSSAPPVHAPARMQR
jgi:hypothetical protein